MVEFAAGQGWVTGHDGDFRPDDPISREEMAVMVMGALASLGQGGGGGATPSLTGFADTNQISQWAWGHMAAAIQRGLLQGMGDGTLAPRHLTTRAQAAVLARRHWSRSGCWG